MTTADLSALHFLENLTMSNDPCRTALADQVDAANAEQARVIGEISRIYQAEHHAELTPFALGLLADLARRYIDGRTNFCAHLGTYSPQPGHWQPSLPGRIRCGLCFARSGRRMKGTRQDHSCDSCGRFAYKALRMSSFSLPGKVLDMSSGLQAWPPLSVYFFLCPSCLDGQVGA